MLDVTLKTKYAANAVRVTQNDEMIDLVIGVPDSSAYYRTARLEWESAMALGKALTAAAESARMAVEDMRRRT